MPPGTQKRCHYCGNSTMCSVAQNIVCESNCREVSEAGGEEEQAKTLCESLSCWQQLISTIMRDSKYDCSVKDWV